MVETGRFGPRQARRIMVYSVPLVDPAKEDCFMQTAHFTALSAKHNSLDQRIAAESQRPAPDQMLIAELKKRKLRVKEEMAR
jgi:hypothetical protein